MESRIHGNMYVRFGGRSAETCCRKAVRRRKPSLLVYWDMLVKDRDGRRISSDEYRAMTKEERQRLEAIPFVKSFPVYNVAQTNLAEIQPERMQKLLDRFKVPELRDTEGMYAHAALDRMVQTQQWLCPIQADKRVDGAFYSPSQLSLIHISEPTRP